jgi:hypothetical protein
LKSGIVAQKDADKIVPYIDIEIDKRGITKNRILMLDILANFDWKRPIYFTGGANAEEEYIWLKDYLQLDGVAFKLVPIRTPTKLYNQEGKLVRELTLFDIGRIDPKKMEKNLMNLDWRNINDGKIYLDEQTKRNTISLRNSFQRLSDAYAIQGDTLKAKEMLDFSIEKMPIKDFDHYTLSVGYPEMYYKLGAKKEARETAETLLQLYKEKALWLSTFSKEFTDIIIDEIDTTLYIYNSILSDIKQYDEGNYFKEKQEEFTTVMKLFSHLIEE